MNDAKQVHELAEAIGKVASAIYWVAFMLFISLNCLDVRLKK